MIEIKDAKLRDLHARAERAQADLEEGKKQLFRSDGAKLYSEDEHREQLRALERERNGVLKDVEGQAREIRVGVESEIAGIEHADPADTLTLEELERANQLRAFALDTAEILNPETFGKRLEAVLAGGDKGNIFAYYMAGRRKSAEKEGRVPFRAALDGMEAALGGGQRAQKVEAAKRKEREALEVESLAHHLQTGARGAAGAYLAQTYGRRAG